MRAIVMLTSVSIAYLTLASCAGGGAGPLGIGAIAGNRNLAAAEPLFSREEESCMGSADRLIGTIFGGPDEASASKAKWRTSCARIRANFRFMLPSTAAGTTPRYDASQRNEIIDALMASSNRKCTRYAALLKNADGAMNAGLSVGAIVTGGLGSILGGVNTAKALAGSSSILSGSRAALNDTYLSNQTIHVLTAAFEKARRAQRRVITNRQACSVEQYTLMRGVEDSFAYHQSCSLVAGLAETALSIERSENPGLDTMRQQFNELVNLRRQAAEFAKEGPITPIAPTPTPVSLEKLKAADQALVDAVKAMADASAAEAAAEANLAKSKAALAAQTASDKSAEIAAVDKASKEAAKAHAASVRLTEARDAAGAARDKEVRALVHLTAPLAGPSEPETRVCPFS